MSSNESPSGHQEKVEIQTCETTLAICDEEKHTFI